MNDLFMLLFFLVKLFLSIVLGLFVLYAAIKLGTFAFYQGKHQFKKEQENERKSTNGEV